ncbi:tetratricopeptide repeat protein [Halobacillus litoralis]|uniref:tetratricopeptide repeat protein n=1 Tax=Halobacillus litoralis TaxID=45668 RepID=UPI001CD31D41|nr:tetratricopeptide repeat protein [Halobacillus litoralis]MCA0969899.1 tetratricopeptide repeat protein [Halobacillus litoralis]
MENEREKVVMFPKWKTRLEKVGFEALKQKRYTDAVEALEPLLAYEVASDDVVTGLLMSWIETGEFDKAEDLCQKQMKVSLDEQYYHYLHMYITILFKRNRYQEIVDLLEEVFQSEDIPHQSRTQLWQMFEVSRKLLEGHQKEQGNKWKSDFLQAVESKDLSAQWRALDQLRKQSASSHIEEFKELLTDSGVHPIIKTSIIEWFTEAGVDETLPVVKFGQTFEIVPSELNQFQSDYIIKQIQMRLGDMEQSNPTMYEMTNKLLYRYFYVRYPIFPTEEEVPVIVEALKQLGHYYLQIPYQSEQDFQDIERYKEEIELCEQHYTMLVGES